MEPAVYRDCEELIDKFIESKDYSFKSFCGLWKGLAFPHIFSVQTSNAELIQTVAAAFHSAKRMACGKRFNGQVKPAKGDFEEMMRPIGSVYLMYVLYFKQPTKDYVKIEITMNDWKRLRALVGALKAEDAHTNEVQFMFWKLLHSHAFRFTALDFPVGLDRLVDYDDAAEEEVSGRAGVVVSSNQLLRDFSDIQKTKSALPALSALEDGYNEMKEHLTVTEGINVKALPPTNIFKLVGESFNNITKAIESFSKDSDRPERDGGNSLRRDLKRKAFRSDLTETKESANESSDSGDECREPSRRYRGRMSVRSVFDQLLPDEILQDLQGNEDNETDTVSD